MIPSLRRLPLPTCCFVAKYYMANGLLSLDIVKTTTRNCVRNAFRIFAVLSLCVAARGFSETRVVAWGTGYSANNAIITNFNGVVAVAAGYYHSLGLRSNGTVTGESAATISSIPAGLSNVVAIAVNAFASGSVRYSFALKSDGTVTAWSNSFAPFVPVGFSNVVAISVGLSHALALRNNGKVVAWGSGSATNVPTSLSNAVAVAAGANYSLALNANGTVTSWGSAPTVPRGGLSNVVAIAAGYFHALALKTDGKVIAWGNNTYGQISVPTNLAGVASIACGTYYSLALKSNGTVVVWGYSFDGNFNVPGSLTNVTAISAGRASMALVGEGPPFFLSHPQGRSVLVGTNVTLTERAMDTSPLSYQWRFNGTNILDATGISLTLSNMTIAQSGSYSVVVTNIYGSATSSNAIVNVFPFFFTSVPGSQSILASGSVTFRVAATTNALPLSYQWRFNGADLTGATESSLTLSNVAVSQGGYYSVLVSNVFGARETTPVLLQVFPFFIISPPKSQTALAGDSVTFTVSVASNTAPTYQWLFNGAEIPGATESRLTLTNLAFDQAGSYSVAMTNTFGGLNSSNAVLTVVPILISNQPSSQTVFAGGVAILSVKVSTNAPPFYQWRYNGTNLAGATESSLTLSNVLLSQAGMYSVLVTNRYGALLSSNATLTVLPLLFTKHPASQTRYCGETVTFSASVMSAVPLSYQWHFNGSDLPGATESSLILTNVLLAQAGSYSVTASNVFGSVISSIAFLSLVPQATIVALPQNISTFRGATATFSTTAFGEPPLNYQWQMNGANLPGETGSALVLTNVQFDQSATYSVVVTNAFRTVAANATLIVGLVVAWGSEPGPPVPVTNLPIAIAAGSQYSVALASDRTLIFWSGASLTPLILTGVVSIAGGSSHTLALTENGTVSTWGDNQNGQTNVPPGLSDVVAIAGGGFHSLALRSDGTVVAWGRSMEGQTSVPSSASNIVAIAGGRYHSLALTSGGEVLAWGYNFYGQTTIPSGLSGVVGIGAGAYHSVAMKSDGTVIAWGENNFGQADVPPGLTEVIAISVNSYHTLALLQDGTVVAWGFNDGRTDVPFGLLNVSAVGAGGSHSLAIVGDAPPLLRAPMIPTRCNNGIAISIQTRSGRVYRLEYINSIDDTNWTALPLVAGNGGIKTLTDSTATGMQRFYRVRQW